MACFEYRYFQRLKEEEEVLFKEKSDEFRRNAVLKQTLMQLEKSRIRRNSTGSSWSSSHSESSTDSDKGLTTFDSKSVFCGLGRH